MPTKIAHGLMPMKLRILVSLASCGWLLYVTSNVFLVLECHVGLYFFNNFQFTYGVYTLCMYIYAYDTVYVNSSDTDSLIFSFKFLLKGIL